MGACSAGTHPPSVQPSLLPLERSELDVTRQLPRRPAIFLAIAVTLSACSATPEPAAEPTSFTRNMKTWRQPLDDFYPASVDQNYAASLATSACMRDAGVKNWPVEDPSKYLPPTFTRRVRKMFDQDIAKAYGYHAGLGHTVEREVPPPLTPEQEASLAECQEGAFSRLGLTSPILGYVQGLAGAAAEDALHSDAVESAARGWRECMLPLGLPDLPETPLGNMPTETQRVRFGLTDDDTDETKVQPATPQEIREATMDAGCRESSGYTAALYDQEVSSGLAAIKKQPERISEALKATEQFNKKIRAIIAKQES